MNPSAEDVLKAVEAVNADHIVILPNNKNIILTAEQAVHLAPEGKTIHVIPTRSIPQGVSCLVSFVDSEDVNESLSAMNDAIEFVHSGQITTAVRDTVLDGREIKEGDILCLYDGEIALVCEELHDSAKQLADYMLSHGGDVVSVYFGEGVSEEQANGLADYITGKHKGCEVEVYNGQQPLYNYILSVE
jgi:hypothetical protein